MIFVGMERKLLFRHAEAMRMGLVNPIGKANDSCISYYQSNHVPIYYAIDSVHFWFCCPSTAQQRNNNTSLNGYSLHDQRCSRQDLIIPVSLWDFKHLTNKDTMCFP